MARAYPMQNSFNAGEFSPALAGRSDITKYASGAALVQNLIVQPEGGLKHRPGTRYVTEVKNSATKHRLVPFIVSTIQGYMLEFGNNLIRFYKDEGIIESGGNPVELVTTYTTAQIPELTFAQTTDALYICHDAHPPAKLTRSSDIAWTLSDLDPQDGPYLKENLTTTTLLTSANTGNGVTLTASSVTGINDGDGFKTSDIGRLVRLKKEATPEAGTRLIGWAEIVGWTSTTVVTIDIKSDFEPPAGPPVATTEWRLGAFGSSTDIGYPALVVFYEQRLWFGANPGATQTIYGSVISLLETFGPTEDDGLVLDDNGLVYTIAADENNVVRWLDSTRTMILGTSGGIWPVQATTTLEPITPTNISIKRSDVADAAAIRPVHVDDISVYVSDSKRKVLSVGFVGERDSFIANDLTLLAAHITQSGIDEITYAREPHSVVWGVRGDGMLVGLTNVTAQEVFAWHRHIIGGSFTAGEAVVESVAVIPSTAGDPSSVGRTNIPHDQVWMIVKRTINGSTVRYVEFIEDDFADDDILDDAFFVDSGLTYNSTPTAAISSGLSHLEGETVQVVADGAAHPDRTVSSGAIALNGSYSVIHVGLYQKAQVDTLNIEPTLRSGSAQSRRKRIPSVLVRLDRSLGGEICNVPDPSKTGEDVFTGTGADTALPTSFGFNLETNLVVTRIVTATGVETTMVLNTDYVVTGGGFKIGTVTPLDGATDFPTTVKWKVALSPAPVNYDPIFFRQAGAPMDAPPALFTGDKEMTLECGWSRDAKMSLRQTQPLPWHLVALIPNVEVAAR